MTTETREESAVWMGRPRVNSTIPVTLNVLPHEPAYLVAELDLQPPDSKGWRRFQVIQVGRDGKLYEYWEDMGPRENHRTGQFRFPCGVAVNEEMTLFESLYTVADAKAIADEFRNRTTTQADLEETMPVRRLLADFADEVGA